MSKDRMNTVRTESSNSNKSNLLIWFFIVLLVLSSLWVSYEFVRQEQLYRWAIVLGALLVSFFLASRTTEGKQFFKFFQESRQEIRKIIWPSRHETVQMTGLVVLIVLVMGIALWSVDAILFRLMALITG